MTIPEPGDFGLTTIPGPLNWWINLGQALIGDSSRFTHAFIVISDTQCVEAARTGARIGSLHKYDHQPTVYSHFDLTDTQRAAIVTAARGLVGTPYSFLDYLALALDHWHIRPAWLKRYIADSGHMICSQLEDECYRRSGIQQFGDGRDPMDVTPGDLLYVAIAGLPDADQ